jgi:hypothetical protein
MRSIEIGGRYHLYTDKRWVGFSTNFGSQTENHNQGAGTASEPVVIFNQFGPFVLDGSSVKQLCIAGRCDHAEASGIDVRLYHQTGPWSLGWDTLGETSRTLLLSADNLNFAGSAMRRHILNIDQPIVGDGFLLMMLRPVGVLSVIRYLVCSANIIVEQP